MPYRPDSPTTSVIPPIREATTGSPEAIACGRTSGAASARSVGKRNTFAAARYRATSSRGRAPANVTSASTPSRCASASSCSRSPPWPTITSLTSGLSRARWLSASIAWCMPLSRLSRPTHTRSGPSGRPSCARASVSERGRNTSGSTPLGTTWTRERSSMCERQVSSSSCRDGTIASHGRKRYQPPFRKCTCVPSHWTERTARSTGMGRPVRTAPFSSALASARKLPWKFTTSGTRR